MRFIRSSLQYHLLKITLYTYGIVPKMNPKIYSYKVTYVLRTQGANESICVVGVGAHFARVSTQKKCCAPPPWQHCAPLKNSFFEKILIPFLTM